MWVSVHDLFHRALWEECAQLAPQATPLLSGQAPGPAVQPVVTHAALHPGVPWQAVALPGGGLSEALLVWKTARMLLAMWRQSRAGTPCRVVVLVLGAAGVALTTPALAARGALTRHRTILMMVLVASSK